jgi:hypothetical protein
VSGGGGGGRLAIYALTNEFSGSMTANGGQGFAPGGDGTIYLTSNSVPVVVPSVPVAALLSLTQPQNTSLATLSWTGVPGAVYQVESTTDFLHWQPLGALLAGSDGKINLWLSSAAERSCFFRVVPAN